MITIITVGKIKEKYIREGIDECLKKGAEVAASVVQVFEPWVE